MDTLEVLIHIHPDLSDEERGALNQDLQGAEGVATAHFSEVTHHILMVKYDANVTDAHKILAQAQSRDPVAAIVST
jgi:hypothetical protein